MTLSDPSGRPRYAVGPQSDEARQILEAIDRWLERQVRPHVMQLEHDDVWPAEMVEQMKALGLFVFPSQGNFVLVDFDRPAKPIEDALLKRGVIVRPMGGYGLPTCLRITVGLPTENDELLTALTAVLTEDLA